MQPLEKKTKHKSTWEIIKQRIRIGVKKGFRLFYPVGVNPDSQSTDKYWMEGDWLKSRKKN